MSYEEKIFAIMKKAFKFLMDVAEASVEQDSRRGLTQTPGLYGVHLDTEDNKKRIDQLNKSLSEKDDKINLFEEEVKILKEDKIKLKKMQESQGIVGDIMADLVKSLYQYVHQKLPCTNNHYNLSEIDKHMRRYQRAEDRREAEQRWLELKGTTYFSDLNNVVTTPKRANRDFYLPRQRRGRGNRIGPVCPSVHLSVCPSVC